MRNVDYECAVRKELDLPTAIPSLTTQAGHTSKIEAGFSVPSATDADDIPAHVDGRHATGHRQVHNDG